ncbi:MAG: DUF1684 domain-containing protein [Bacteroidia bacterium]
MKSTYNGKIALGLLIFGLTCIYSCTPKEVAEHKIKITAERANKNNEFLMSGSPLKTEDLPVFSGLKYFPINYSYLVKAQISIAASPKTIILEQGDTVKQMLKYGKVTFSLLEKEFSLTVYKPVLDALSDQEDYLFVPFFDATNGIETYAGGRYLYPEMQVDGSLIIDFNSASNPYCAYNHKYNCVMPPQENTIDFEIKAGEKSYH